MIVISGVGSGRDSVIAQIDHWQRILGSGWTYIPYSYASGQWVQRQDGDWLWVWNDFRKSNTYQDVNQSARYLGDEIAGVKQHWGGRVVVIGFSLGGLVAYNALWTALADNTPERRADVTVTLASPLQGIDPGKRAKCAQMLLAGILGGAATGGLLGLAFVGLGAVADAACPVDPVVSQLESMYGDPGWRASRDRYVIGAAHATGARLMTAGNANDCMYYLDCVSLFGGGTNVRFTALVQGADASQMFNVPPPCNSGLGGCLLNVHSSILTDAAVDQAIARFTAA